MKLTFEQIKSLTTGANRVEETGSGIVFHRFSLEQVEIYRGVRDYFYGETFCPAGVKIRFLTNSKNISIKFFAQSVVYEKYILMDIEKDGNLIGSIGNVPDENVKNPFDTQLSGGEFSGKFTLGDGQKEICIHLPYTAPLELIDVCLDDGCEISRAKDKKIWFAFGDSITMGFQAVRPSARYISKVAGKLGYTEYNFGIGGEIFCPYLAQSDFDVKPDIISVAYGTNYWSRLDEQKIISDCDGFIWPLCEKFPDTKIIVITPVWRGDIDAENSPKGELSKITEIINKTCEKYDNLFVVDGIDLIPHDVKYYLDGRLHPNDAGFEYFSENLIKRIENIL